MIIGVGVDLLHIERLANSLSDHDPFILKTFTENERTAARRSEDLKACYGSMFACKEAVFKALRTHGNSVRLQEIEISHDTNGCPSVELSGAIGRIAADKGIRSIEISVSSDNGFVIAYSVAQN